MVVEKFERVMQLALGGQGAACVQHFIDVPIRSNTAEGEGIDGVEHTYELYSDLFHIVSNKIQLDVDMTYVDTFLTTRDIALFKTEVCPTNQKFSIDAADNIVKTDNGNGLGWRTTSNVILWGDSPVFSGQFPANCYLSWHNDDDDSDDDTLNIFRVRASALVELYESGVDYGNFGTHWFQAVKAGANVNLEAEAGGEGSGAVQDTDPLTSLPLAAGGFYVGFRLNALLDRGADSTAVGNMTVDNLIFTEAT